MESVKISLAAARVNAGLTQSDVAEKLGVTKQTILDWEKGRSEPKVSQAIEMSELFNMPLSAIFFNY